MTTATLPTSGGPITIRSSVVNDLRRMAERPGPKAPLELARFLSRLRADDTLSAKARIVIVEATSSLLERVDPSATEWPILASILHGLTPHYLARGTRSKMLALLGTALRRAMQYPDDLDGRTLAAILGAVGLLPLDDKTKVIATDALDALAPRLRKVAARMAPEQLADSSLPMRLARGQLAQELLLLLLRRGLEVAEDWTPHNLATLCRGVLSLRPTPEVLRAAADLLGKTLGSISADAPDLDIGEAAAIFAAVAEVPALRTGAADAFLVSTLPALDGAAAELRPAEVVSVLRGLGNLELRSDLPRLVSSFVQRILLAQKPGEFQVLEAARLVMALPRLPLDDNAGAVAGAFALAMAPALQERADILPIGELVGAVVGTGKLPVDSAEARGFALSLVPALQRRASKVPEIERDHVLRTFDALMLAEHPAVLELLERWRPSHPAARTPRQPEQPILETPGGTPLKNGPSLTMKSFANQLGISKTELYRQLSELQIPTPGRGGFTPDLLERLLGARTKPAKPAKVAKVAPAPTKKERPASARGPRTSFGDAAKAIGAHTSAVRRWIEEEKDLGKLVTREGRRIWFSDEAMTVLRQVHEKRMAAAPASLRAAWAARRAAPPRSSSAKPNTTAAPMPAKKPAPPPSASGLTAAQAAKELGVSKSHLYNLLTKHQIRRPGGRGAFTPELLAKLKAVPAPKVATKPVGSPKAEVTPKPAPTAKSAPPSKAHGMTAAEAARELGVSKSQLYILMTKHHVPRPGGRGAFTPEMVAKLKAVPATRVAPKPVTPPKEAIAQKPEPVPKSAPASPAPSSPARHAADSSGSRDAALIRMVAVVEQLAADFRSTVQELLAQQRILIERVARPISLTVTSGD